MEFVAVEREARSLMMWQCSSIRVFDIYPKHISKHNVMYKYE